MIILHSSDLHSDISRLWQFTEFDIWIDTGDFFPNSTRGNARIEQPFQADWLKQHLRQIAGWLRGRPMISLQGNHDYIMLADHLRAAGMNAHQLNAVPHEVTINNVTFAGFSNIPYIIGEWNHETHNAEMQSAVRNMLQHRHSVLLTHAPPHGILDADGKNHYGIQQLTNVMMYYPHNITHHLFGHVHEDGGKCIERSGIKFYNSARRPQLIEL